MIETENKFFFPLLFSKASYTMLKLKETNSAFSYNTISKSFGFKNLQNEDLKAMTGRMI